METELNKKIIWIVVALAMILSIVIATMAPLSQGEASRVTAQIAPVDDAWRAALPRDPVAATDAYMARISPAAKSRSDAYFEGGYWLQLVDLVVGIAAAVFLLRSRVLARCRDWIAGKIRHQWLIDTFTAMIYSLLISLITFPLNVYEGYYREHLYGLSNQTAMEWFSENMLMLSISTVVIGVAVGILYIALRRARQSWWIWGAGIGVTLVGIMMLLAPTYIDPLFNTYKPITDERIKAPVMSMMRANGVPIDNLYQFDASKQSNRASANVTGIFGSAAVRMNDNLLNRSSVSEIKAVLGHELGHYTMNHIYKGWMEMALVLVLGFAFVKWSLDRSIAKWGTAFGILDHADIAGLPLFVALFSVFMFVATPINNSLIRTQEAEADIFGINASTEPLGFAEAMLKLTEYRKSDPGALEEFVFFDHPSPRKRIYTAMRWRAEQLKP
jgi:STE24 endopeptidase